jgi:hypothetical protein
MTVGWTDTEAFGNAGSEALEQGVSSSGHSENDVSARGLFQVDCHRSAATVQEVEVWIELDGGLRGVYPVDSYHVGSQVSQDHGRERGCSESGDLYDPQAL